MTDSPWYHGIMLILMMIAFIGLSIWAWSRKRKKEFHEASLLPLEEDDGNIPVEENEKD